ncbi:hypothetical protein GCM10010305_18250 [Streptomyces termitum]|uniref:Uncharacterized protein n=1 Tax=Streptomyces termitum TaxID=67368 RepID=A0A918SWL6_9ACTN|nr:hypothetical protein GCM10010305_18250 [Streptomyces termitum]
MGLGNTVVNLSAHFNNRGIQPPDTSGEYGFNIWRNTFPAEELPEPGSLVELEGTVFAFPARDTGAGDNVRCRGQLVELPAGRWDWIGLVGAAERRTEDEVELHHADGTVRREWLRMSDFWPQTAPYFGEPLAFSTSGMRYPRHTHRHHAPSLWQQRVPVRVPAPLAAVRLPDNPAMHVFAMTVTADEESRLAR